jgi:hypothetical protein
MLTPQRGLLAGLLALIVFAAGAVALTAQAPNAAAPVATQTTATQQAPDGDSDGRHGRRFAGFRGER